MSRLANKVAVVAGGATGIGAACAIRYAAEGAKVVIGDFNIDTARELAESIGPNAIAVRYDAADADSIKALIDSAVETFGTLNVLHNNVAITSLAIQSQDTTVVDIPLEIWNATLNINVTSFLLGSKYAIPHMIAAGGGSIINTSSDSGRVGDVVRTAYGASKAAVISLTQHIAVQYGLQGVRCNAITPGVILTGAMKEDPALVEFIRPHILTPNFGVPEDIAALATFLASDESVYITGQAIACDGGHLAHQPQMADVRRAMNNS
ncbi:MAG: SDR family oxidoreductase [Porticoccaceae bacterium]|jgi:NAD(P)-dependent dehydrogenase (short-subunit alcohol dehydrogenase family)|nr:SDR family oxidoreductase [Porticoccaceae bacterium]MEA3301127.1 SDR family oxidoreductase [Pseudomonadota bacterium]HLS98503.1 SDR family oxidoreductase [Porticoccaceae bacterium]